MIVYVDTNVISQAVRGARKGARRRMREDGRRLLRLMREGRHRGVIAPFGIMEIEATPDAHLVRRMLKELKRSRVERVSVAAPMDVEALAELYLSRQVVRPKAVGDAHHLAWATLAGADVMASWNRRDLVRLNTRQRVAIINVALGYKPVLIQTPTEVLDEWRE